MTHRHWFHALSTHFGPYGDENVHWHPCEGDADVIDRALDEGTERTLPQSDCDWVLLGVGRDCGGPKTRHWSQSLEARLESERAWDEWEALESVT